MSDQSVCRWLVTAGFGGEAPADRFTRTFVVTHDDWGGGDVAGQRLRGARRQEALAYATRLMSDELLSWVRLDYRSYDHPWTDGSAAETSA